MDDDFYNNGQILNGGISPETATYGTANNAHKKHMQISHRQIMDSAKLAPFEPLEMPDPPRLMTTNLPEDCEIDNPISFFEIFFNEGIYELLAKNTNKYARAWSSIYPEKKPPPWTDVTVEEIKVYIALLIWFGIYRHKDPYSHWKQSTEDSPIHHMKWARYREIKRMFKISDIDTDREHADIAGDWHYKLSPLDEHLQTCFQEVVVPGSQVSYDEIMIPFRGSRILTGIKYGRWQTRDICTIGCTFRGLQEQPESRKQRKPLPTALQQAMASLHSLSTFPIRNTSSPYSWTISSQPIPSVPNCASSALVLSALYAAGDLENTSRLRLRKRSNWPG
ncbi:hypothetical protein NA56DRAFT_354308 [Hyaloscypha hepaticicola]|uniref:PiggyBac transposable element-derived protein domain-containing protein n=1 Tax=Hyaloscypha hepaticicola TaxID=2082293 RepID=A0A2J6PMH9_9HELO|nr:hypothetical protein NA56DRAFT_354308 [Hyaloscypha hepaticicola]